MGIRDWFSARGAASPRAEKPSAQPAAPAAEIHRSLGTAAFFRTIAGADKLQVLDLGPAIGSNVEFLSKYGCKLYIEDLYAALAARSPALQEDGPAGQAFFAEFLPFPADVRFDAVLAWDLFNYLERRELGQLALYLKPFCNPGAPLLALLSILKQMPAQPMRFKFVDEENLAYERRTTAERPSPRYAPAELNELLRGFHQDRTFLLRHGIQEYLFLRDAD